jgi:hypothetical protein
LIGSPNTAIFPLKHLFSAASVAKLFWDNVVKLHGVPKTIVSGRDKIFTSHFWTELFKLLKTDLKFNSAYHPQYDGQTKRVNQCIEMFLRCAVQTTPRQWTKWPSLAELWYNTSFHSSLQCCPFKALYAVEPSPGLFPQIHLTDHQDVADTLRECQFFTEMLKDHLAKAQNRMKIQVDNNRVERSFQVDEQVLLKLQPYAQSSVVNRHFPKLAYKYFGPYVILEKIGVVAYKLQLPDGSMVHPVFHVSQLKAFTPDYTPVHHQLRDLPKLHISEVIFEEIVDRGLVKKGNEAITQILVKWSGIPVSSATWKDYFVLKKKFPSALIWSSAVSSGGDSVTTAVVTASD